MRPQQRQTRQVSEAREPSELRDQHPVVGCQATVELRESTNENGEPGDNLQVTHGQKTLDRS